jgi:hypothetical protein
LNTRLAILTLLAIATLTALTAGEVVISGQMAFNRTQNDPGGDASPEKDPGKADPSADKAAGPRPRVVVLTDISNEPDDEQSLIRFLVYANEFEVEGLIATTSVWLKDKVRPDLIQKTVNAYGQVRDNLSLHAPGYPTKEQLLKVVKSSRAEFGMAGVGEGKTSEGAEHLIRVVDRDDPRPVWVTVWGGPNCLAQALWQVKQTRTKEQLDAFVAKLRVYTISDQDDSGPWLRHTFPQLFYVVSPSTVDNKEYHKATWTGISGDRHYKNCPGADFSLVDDAWLEKHVRTGHGPLGDLYPKVAYIMEGDTPSFLNLIGNGLAAHEEPAYGGWGGRYELRQSYGETRPIYTNSRDTVEGADGKSYTSDQATVWRWREAYQHDFAARMDWCVKAAREANHNPVVVVNDKPGKEVVRLTAKTGKEVKLSAAGTKDPDGDQLTYHWLYYLEAGTFKGAVEIKDAQSVAATLTAPKVKNPERIHIIVAVKDNGTPSLHAYRRVILTIEP